MNNPDIVCYIAIDNPKKTVQYGGVVAAPLVGEALSQILPYLNIKKDYDNQINKVLRWGLDTKTYLVPNVIGKSKKEILNTPYYKYVCYGEGNKVIYQSPDAGEYIKEGDTIMLYMG